MTKETNRKKQKTARLGLATGLTSSLAFGGMAFCAINEVDADIVSSSVSNMLFTLTTGFGVNLDVDGGGVNDLRFFNSTDYQFIGNGSANARVRGSGTVGGSTQLRAFATGLGTYVVSGGNGNRASLGYMAYSSSIGSNWLGGAITRNFAYDFFNESTNETNYGWGTIQYSGTNSDFTIVQLYYENEGNSITVGDVGVAVPEPSSLALLALGAAGIGAYRRKKKAV